MKKFISILLCLIFTALLFYFNKTIESKKEILSSNVNTNNTLQSKLDVNNDSLRILEGIENSLNLQINSVNKEIKNVQQIYHDRLRLVEEQNKQFEKSLDQDGSGTPDFIEQGDFNGNGIPDAVEH